MKQKKIIFFACCILGISGTALADNKQAGENPPGEARQRLQNSYEADNTGRNERDRRDEMKTADDQSNSQSDINTAAEIRHRITRDKSLSTNAHNVKIVVEGGKVTLRGPVASEREKVAIVRTAVDVAGVPNVTNQLEIAHPRE